MATGDDNSASAPGVFAEGYWNLGWPGVAFVCAYLGVFFAALETIAEPFLRALDFRWLASGMYALLIALRPDDWFVPTCVTGGALTLAYLLMVLLLVPSKFANEGK
jgi:hypothetical protein